MAMMVINGDAESKVCAAFWSNPVKVVCDMELLTLWCALIGQGTILLCFHIIIIIIIITIIINVFEVVIILSKKFHPSPSRQIFPTRTIGYFPNIPRIRYFSNITRLDISQTFLSEHHKQYPFRKSLFRYFSEHSVVLRCVVLCCGFSHSDGVTQQSEAVVKLVNQIVSLA